MYVCIYIYIIVIIILYHILHSAIPISGGPSCSPSQTLKPVAWGRCVWGVLNDTQTWLKVKAGRRLDDTLDPGRGGDPDPLGMSQEWWFFMGKPWENGGESWDFMVVLIWINHDVVSGHD